MKINLRTIPRFVSEAISFLIIYQGGILYTLEEKLI